jgi:hypothetical protein
MEPTAGNRMGPQGRMPNGGHVRGDASDSETIVQQRAPTGAKTPRVVFVAGWARSGSTLLGNLLGQVEGCFFAGELRFFAERAWRENRLCGCGRPLLDCEVWSEIISGLAPRIGDGGRALLESIPGRGLRTRSMLREFLPFRLRTPSRSEQEVLPALEALYQEIAAVTRASVIVDSSRSPMYARLLERIPGMELDVIHLVRDARATAFSLRRRKYDPSGSRFMYQAGPAENAMMWVTWNLAAERLRKRPISGSNYLRLRYEDLAGDPASVLPSASDFARLPGDLPHVSSTGAVTLKVNHSVMGNPNRMESGPTTIKTDQEWTRAMSWRDKAATDLLTWPLLLRYGYSVRG